MVVNYSCGDVRLPRGVTTTHRLRTANVELRGLESVIKKSLPALTFIKSPLEGIPFPLGGFFQSWQCLKEKDSWSVRLSESGLRSGSWGIGSSIAKVFKSWLPALLFLALIRGERMAIVCFLFCHTKAGPALEGRKKFNVLGHEPCWRPEWSFCLREPLLIPMGETLTSATEEKSHLQGSFGGTNRGSQPCGGKDRPEPTSLWTRLRMNAEWGLLEIQQTQWFIFMKGQTQKSFWRAHMEELFDLFESEPNEKWRSRPLLWDSESRKLHSLWR